MIFVTGANGLIGSYICRDLLRSGYKIRALKRKNSELSLVCDIEKSIEWVEGDILDPLILEETLQQVEWVIHCAAFISYDSKDEDTMYHINVEGTANLVNACLKVGVPYFLHVSSVAAIGKDKSNQMVDEQSQLVNLEATTSYARSKYLSELEIWRGTTEGLKAVIINPSLVIGPGDWAKSSTRIFKYIWDEKRFYTGGIANFVDVRDVSAVVMQLMKANIFGERFILNAGSVPYKELFDRIAYEFGKKPPGIKVKGLWIKFAIFADKIRAGISGSKPLITDELEQVSKNRHVFDNTKIRTALGFSFRNLEETVRWCCQQIMQNPKQLN